MEEVDNPISYKFLLIITITAVITASYFSYIIGIIYGKRITIKLIGEEKYDLSYEYSKKYGKLGIAILALTPLPYFPILAGLFKMNLKDFTIYAVISRIIHFLIFGWILYWLLA